MPCMKQMYTSITWKQPALQATDSANKEGLGTEADAGPMRRQPEEVLRVQVSEIGCLGPTRAGVGTEKEKSVEVGC